MSGKEALRRWMNQNAMTFSTPDGKVHWGGIDRENMMNPPGLDDLPEGTPPIIDTPADLVEPLPDRYLQDKVEVFGAAIGQGRWEADTPTVAVPVRWLTTASNLITTQRGRIAAWDKMLRDARLTDSATGGILRFPGTITPDGDYEDNPKHNVQAENADPMYLRAKAALDEIGAFRRIEVDHETDIATVSSDGGYDTARYRSGLNEVTITIHGYLR